MAQLHTETLDLEQKTLSLKIQQDALVKERRALHTNTALLVTEREGLRDLAVELAHRATSLLQAQGEAQRSEEISLAMTAKAELVIKQAMLREEAIEAAELELENRSQEIAKNRASLAAERQQGRGPLAGQNCRGCLEKQEALQDLSTKFMALVEGSPWASGSRDECVLRDTGNVPPNQHRTHHVPSTQFYKEPSTQFYKEPSTQFYKEPSTQCYKEPSTQFYKEPSTQFYKEPSTQFYKEPSTQFYKEPSTQPGMSSGLGVSVSRHTAMRAKDRVQQWTKQMSALQELG